MEIKQGDNVRVSGNTPKVYLSSVNNLFKYHVSKVEETDGDSAKIRYTDIGIDRWLTIPCKYLVKVDTEAKFKVGDKVVVHYPSGDRIGHIKEVMLDGTYDIDYGGGCTGHNITRSQIETYTAPKFKVGDRVKIKKECLDYNKPIDDTYTFSIISSKVVEIEDGIATLYMDSVPPKTLWAKVEVLEKLIEPTEQMEAEEDARIRQMEAELDEFRKAELDRMLHPEKYYTYEVTVNNVAMDWQEYAADLAKEVALKVANKFNAPEQVAEYAVSVAKAVVEGLKNK